MIDDDLSAALDHTLLHALSAIAEAVLVCIGSTYLAAGIPILMLLLYVVQVCYLRTSRQLRLLDIEAKAPLFTNFQETLDGVAPIRAYGWTKEYLVSNRKILNESQKPYYLLYCIQLWLTLVLDLIVAGLAVTVVAITVHVKNAYLGVALFSLVTFGSTLQELVTEWTQLETAIGAVNRVRAFTIDTKKEERDTISTDLAPDWPNDGAITFTNVTASYGNDSSPILNDINLVVRPGSKVAICGRTGR